MKMNDIHKNLLYAVAGVLMLMGCVEDEIYNTDHPDQAKLTVTTVWNDRGEGIEKPAGYIIETGSVKEEVTTDRYTLKTLFNPGEHLFYLYNSPYGITVENGVAVVSSVKTMAGETGDFVEPLPGWLFTGFLNTILQKDTEPVSTVDMHQQIRQLTLVIKAEGSAADEISGITANLTGIAGAWDIVSDSPAGEAVRVAPVFVKQADGTWSATVRLMGISGTQQKLAGIIMIADNPVVITYESELNNELAGFNTDKKNPLTLHTVITIEPDPEVEAGFNATIKEWENGGSGSGIAK